MSTKKLAQMAVLTAAALIIFIIEAQIPVPLPIPGIKLGFANIITLFALFCDGKGRGTVRLTTADALLILLCRIILGAVFTGRIVAFMYSAAGGLLSFAAMVIIKRFVTKNQIWVCGVTGAVFHNAGQISAAMLIMSASAAAYLPVLTAAGIVTGAVTGMAAQLLIVRLGGDDDIS